MLSLHLRFILNGMRKNRKRVFKLTDLISYRYYTQRTKFFAFGSMLANIAMGFGKIVLASLQKAFFFGCNGFYNIVIGIVKMYALRKHKLYSAKDDEKEKYEWETYAVRRLSLMVLAASTFYLGFGIVSMFTSQSLSYGISTVCFIAASAFGKLILNVIGYLKTRKSNDKIINYITATNIADGFVSIGLTQRAILIMMQAEGAYFYSAVGEILFSAFALAVSVIMIFFAYRKSPKNLC